MTKLKLYSIKFTQIKNNWQFVNKINFNQEYNNLTIFSNLTKSSF